MARGLSWVLDPKRLRPIFLRNTFLGFSPQALFYFHRILSIMSPQKAMINIDDKIIIKI